MSAFSQADLRRAKWTLYREALALIIGNVAKNKE
jgi:hypothetical protein